MLGDLLVHMGNKTLHIQREVKMICEIARSFLDIEPVYLGLSLPSHHGWLEVSIVTSPFNFMIICWLSFSKSFIGVVYRCECA